MSGDKVPIRVAILTVSDSVAAGTRDDLSGPALQAVCRELRWDVVTEAAVADEQDAIASQLKAWANSGAASLILTTGGTGVTPRDVTPEATRRVLQTELPGLGELMRVRGLEQTPFAVLSRAVAGTARTSLIVNLPGAPAGAVHSLHAIEHLVQHLVDLLGGQTRHGG